MSTSTILFLSAAGCGVLFAFCDLLRQGLPPLRKVRWTPPLVIFACCCAFGGLAFLLDSDTAGQTLYEIEAEGSGPQAPVAIRFDVPVEHPGVEHSLLVAPRTDEDVDRPAELQVQVTDAAGRVLLDRTETLEPRCDDVCEWDSLSASYTPTGPGGVTMVVTVDTPDVPVLHVYVGDPEKTDGHRIPGY
jgi:hypothetical protein